MMTPTPTPIGSVRFELARRRLAQILGLEVEQVSDAAVIAYLTDGALVTRASTSANGTTRAT